MWDILVDPDRLPKLTPLLSRIEADGEHWRWHLVRLKVLGVGISPVFTERMTFSEKQRISFTHDPPAGVTEWAGAEGHYELSDVDDGTHLAISLDLAVDLPLSKLATPVVTRTMQTTIQMMGDRFSANLLRELKAQQR
ncbi:hypothetical protein [Pseudonocardia sediminis]|uniref:hypothetical protein n=1 Tax=Pseudonocardia sediminis TaxID=1397368 RepID=UPI0010292626|nr:hypothetical protein [Pseudonocardia sediminis]